MFHRVRVHSREGLEEAAESRGSLRQSFPAEKNVLIRLLGVCFDDAWVRGTVRKCSYLQKYREKPYPSMQWLEHHAVVEK